MGRQSRLITVPVAAVVGVVTDKEAVIVVVAIVAINKLVLVKELSNEGRSFY